MYRLRENGKQSDQSESTERDTLRIWAYGR